jgi:hypothetical protein
MLFSLFQVAEFLCSVPPRSKTLEHWSRAAKEEITRARVISKWHIKNERDEYARMASLSRCRSSRPRLRRGAIPRWQIRK